MHFTRLALLAAALNLAISSPILSKKSRDIIASDVAKRALEPIPGTVALSKRNNGYEYTDTPRPSREEEKRYAVAAPYSYQDTPRPSREEKRDAAAASYEYRDTPRPSLEERR